VSARCCRVVLATWLWLVPGCAGIAPPAWELPLPEIERGRVVDSERLQRTTLENGLHVILYQDPSLPLLSLGVLTRRGGDHVSPERAGLAEFTAELMKRGAGARGALALAEAVDEIGANLSVNADWDSMSVQLSGLARARSLLIELLADVVQRPQLRPEEAVRVQAEQLAGIEKAKDDPQHLAGWQLARALYSGHPYGLPLEGARETVAQLAAADARVFHGEVFIARNAVLYAAGNFASEELLSELTRAFAEWLPGSLPAYPPAPPETAPAERRVIVVDRPDLVQAQILVGHEGVARAHPERIAITLLETVLGSGGFSSRLMGSVRSDAGLTYGIYAGFSMRRHAGPFFVSTFTRVPEVKRTVELLLAELARIRSEPPNADELLRAKNYRVGSFALALETSEAVAEGLAELDVYSLPENALDTYRERVSEVTVEDTARLAQKLLHPERAAIVVVGPAVALKPQLESFGLVEVVAP